MNFLGLFRKDPPSAPPPDVDPEVSTQTMEIDFLDSLPAAWGAFVANFASLYEPPSLVQSCGPGRVTGFTSLNDDEAGGGLSRLTDPDVIREFCAEWRTQLGIAPTPRELVAELQQAEGCDRPSIIFLYPTTAELAPDFSSWASARATTDAKRDRANRDALAQGAVIFARLAAVAGQGDEGSVWCNELARAKVAGKAQQHDGARVVAEEVEEIAPETSKTRRKKPSPTPQTR